MPSQDTSQLKERILSIIRSRGPSFPAHISSQVGMSILFTSAFLSELLSEKKLKISHMKIGSSPLYFLPGQENLLERFSGSLKSKEKDAFELLKEKKFLLDSEQEPAIRVALRSIRDFAIPFQKNDKLYWRYLTTQEDEFVSKPETRPIEKKEKQKPKQPPKRKTPVKKKTAKKKSVSNGKNDKFFNRVKEHLLSKGAEISDIISFSKNDLVLKVKDNEKEFIIFAYNKKRVSEEDIVKAYKTVQDFNLSYSILCLGEPAKKILGLIDAVRSLEKIENIG